MAPYEDAKMIKLMITLTFQSACRMYMYLGIEETINGVHVHVSWFASTCMKHELLYCKIYTIPSNVLSTISKRVLN